MADTLPEMEEYSVFDKQVGPQTLVDAMADTLTEVETLITCDTLGDAQALNDVQGDIWRDIGQCAGSGQHGG